MNFHVSPPNVQVPRFAQGVETWIISLHLMPKRLGAKLGNGFLFLIDLIVHGGHSYLGSSDLMESHAAQLPQHFRSLQVCHGVSLHCFACGQVNKPERSRVHLSELHLKTPRQCGKKRIIPYHSAHFHIIPHHYIIFGRSHKSSQHRPLRKPDV